MQKIAAALVKAQKAFGPALKTSSNPHFRSKYAALDACIEAVIDALNNNGVALLQQTQLCDDGVIVETVFLHESGESWSSGALHVPASKQDPQGYGSALTYARRYSLMAACSIAPEDDDGNAASRQHADQHKTQAHLEPASKSFDLSAALEWIAKGVNLDQVKQRGRQAYQRATNEEERARIASLVEELEQSALSAA